MSPKQQLLMMWQQEAATTLRVLGSYPPDRADFQPHERSKSARDLAWTIAITHRSMAESVMGSENDFTPRASAAPGAWPDVLKGVSDAVAAALAALEACDERALGSTIRVPLPAGSGDVPRLSMLWMGMLDTVHHRGQFSVYLRMAGGKVPSIYGPSADEPWS